MLFEELNRNKKMKDPETRKAEDLQRNEKSNTKFKPTRSVSLTTLRVIIAIVTVAVALAVVYGAGWLVVHGLEMYTQSS